MAKYLSKEGAGYILGKIRESIANSAQSTKDAINAKFLSSNGVIKSELLPSYVDDIIEGYLINGVFYRENNTSSTVITGESGKIYVNLADNITYRWSGQKYVEISKSLALGETESTAFAGDRGVRLEGYFINGVAKAVAKLSNPVTIWGKSFDGSSDIDGSIDVTSYLWLRDSTKQHLTEWSMGSDGLHIQALSQQTGAGKKIFINENGGSVQIGNTSKSAKLAIGGTLHADGNITGDADITASGCVIGMLGVSARGISDFSVTSVGGGGGSGEGTITGISLVGTTIGTSGIVNIPEASTSAYGVVKVSNSYTNSSSSLVASAQSVNSLYTFLLSIERGIGSTIGRIADTNNPIEDYFPAFISKKVANALTFGSKTYDGSEAKTISASDLGVGSIGMKDSLSASDIPSLSWSKITSGKPTTLAGYGITDAKIANGVITLGGNTITPLTAHQTIRDLKLQSGPFSATTFDPNGSSDVTVNIPTTTSHISEGDNLYFTNARAQAAITGGASTIVTSGLTASRALVSNANGKVAVSDITSTELSYLDGVSSNIQTQLNAKFPTANFTKANIKSTLGISDWALASTKPTYKAEEVGVILGIDASSSINGISGNYGFTIEADGEEFGMSAINDSELASLIAILNGTGGGNSGGSGD